MGRIVTSTRALAVGLVALGGLLSSMVGCHESPSDQHHHSAGAGASMGGAGGLIRDTGKAVAGLAGVAATGDGGASGDSGSMTAGGLHRGGANGGVSTGGTPATPAPAISNLNVEPNPNSAISAYVTWTTDVPSDSVVQFGIDDYEYRIRDATETTSHRVLVIGMYAETTYRIRARSTSRGGTESAETRFTTGTLPDTVPLPVLTTHATNSQPGWTLVNIQPDSPQGRARPPGLAVMYDEQGRVVWYFVNGELPDELGDVSVDFLPNQNVLLGPTTLDAPKEVDLAGNIVWRGPPQPTAPGGPIMTHGARKLNSGNYILLRNVLDGNGFEGALIEEVTPTNEVVWSWNLFDHLQPDPLTANQDWCHANSVAIDEEKDLLYLSCRWLGVIKAHRHGDQSIVWTLGEGLDGGSFSFDPIESGFADEHDPEFHDDGTVLIYDNGGFTLFPTDHRSRVLEFTLDETNLVATLTWSFPGDFSVEPWYRDGWYTPFWGDADRLANGNVLVTAGMRNQSASGRVFEVDRDDGQIAWEIVFDPNVGCYQSERISPPPLVERL